MKLLRLRGVALGHCGEISPLGLTSASPAAAGPRARRWPLASRPPASRPRRVGRQGVPGGAGGGIDDVSPDQSGLMIFHQADESGPPRQLCLVA